MTDREMLTSAMNESCTPTPCPVCGRKPGAGYINESPCYSFSCSGSWEEPHGTLSGGRQRTIAAAERCWNAAVASYRSPAPEPEPEPEPVTPRRWWWVSLVTVPGGWGGVAHFSGAFCGDTRSAAIDRARERVAARDDGHGAEWLHARTTADELTPAALATMLAESRAWYARELEQSGEVE